MSRDSRRFFTRFALALLTGICFESATVQAQKYDYVTVEEEDLIRDAQELPKRVTVFLQLLDNRIVALDLRERTQKERDQAKKDLETWEREAKQVEKIEGAELRARPLKPDVYLRNTPRTELLRGYSQIVGEIMDNIDDAFERRLEVRGPVESLERFLSEQLPRFRKFEAKTAAETAALKEVVELSEQTIEDCRIALKTLPKTEKKSQ
jgi:hypothetical protein